MAASATSAGSNASAGAFDARIINETLDHTRTAITAKIEALIEDRRKVPGAYAPLYSLLREYPFRVGKMLRPGLCLSVARAVGGFAHQALTSATALEIYHNAFLIHDDLEDGSEHRRGGDTLHQLVGLPRAVNAGDATNVLAVGLLLENLSVIGVARALEVLHEIEHMARQSVEGQAMELDWVAANVSTLSDQDYFTMCAKKTCWYSFITPCRIGLITGTPPGSDPQEALARLTHFGLAIGIAFQIQDDLLNLEGEMTAYGKEIGGDIHEGKRTLMMNHVLRESGRSAPRIRRILALPRGAKSADDVQFILDQMRRCGSLAHARSVARRQADRAREILGTLDFLGETPVRSGENWQAAVADRRFIRELVNYVVHRNL